MKAPSSYLCLPQTLRGSETEAVNGTQTHSLHAISSVLQLLHWQLFSLYTAAGFQTAFQKQRCDLISSPLNLSALLIEPLSLHKRELFQVFPLDAASWLSKEKQCVNSKHATTQCSCVLQWANTLHSLSTLLVKLFNISTTCRLWKHSQIRNLKGNLNLWPCVLHPSSWPIQPLNLVISECILSYFSSLLDAGT